MKHDWVGYLLTGCAAFGFAGLQRFYLNRPVSGMLYLLTWGFFGIGTVYDLVRMRKLVSDANARLLGEYRELRAQLEAGGAATAAELDAGVLTPEQRAASREHGILQCARVHGGTVTTALVALEVKIPLNEAQKELHRLRDAGFCTLDVSESGAEIFTFHGLGSTQPMGL